MKIEIRTIYCLCLCNDNIDVNQYNKNIGIYRHKQGDYFSFYYTKDGMFFWQDKMPREIEKLYRYAFSTNTKTKISQEGNKIFISIVNGNNDCFVVDRLDINKERIEAFNFFKKLY